MIESINESGKVFMRVIESDSDKTRMTMIPDQSKETNQ